MGYKREEQEQGMITMRPQETTTKHIMQNSQVPYTCLSLLWSLELRREKLSNAHQKDRSNATPYAKKVELEAKALPPVEAV